MRDIGFVFLRLTRSKLLLILIAFALLLSLVNIFYGTSSLAVDPDNINFLETYTIGAMMDINRQGGTTPSYDALYHQYLDREKSSEFLAGVLKAIQLDGIDVSDDHYADLEFALLSYDYIESHDYFDEYFESPSYLYLIRKGSKILFGILPLLFFFVLGVWLLGENYEQESIAFHGVLPVKHRRLLSSYFLSLVILSVLYVLMVLTASLLFSTFFGIPFGHMDYPVRVFGNPLIYLRTDVFILRNLCLFLFRVAFSIAFGLFLANVIRRVSTATFIGSFILLLSLLMTNNIARLQRNGNPFFFDAEKIFSGRRSMILSRSNSLLGYESIEPLGVDKTLLVLVFLTCLFLLLSGLRPYLDQWININFRKSVLPSSHPVIFEWKKLQSIMSLPSSLGLLMLLTLSFYSILAFTDYGKVQEFQSILHTHEESLVFHLENISRLEEEIETSTGTTKDDLERELQQVRRQLEDEKAQGLRHAGAQKAYQEKKGPLFYESQQGDIDNYFIETFNKYVNGNKPSNFSRQVSEDRLEILIRQENEPIYGLIYQPSIYDKTLIPQDALRERLLHQPFNHSFFLSLYRLFDLYRFDLLLLGMLAILLGSGFSTDYEYGLAWMLTLPKKRSELIKEKMVASMSLGLSLLGGFVILVLILSLLTQGLGDWNLPILEYTKPLDNAYQNIDYSGNYGFIPVGLMILRILLSMVTSLFFLLAFSIFLSTFKLKPVLLALLVTTISVFGYVSLSTLGVIGSFLPFSHLNPFAIATGIRYVETSETLYRLLPSSFILLLWGFVFLILGTLRMTREGDIL